MIQYFTPNHLMHRSGKKQWKNAAINIRLSRIIADRLFDHPAAEFRRAFTLIELLLVVSIIAVITGFSVSYYSRFVTENAVKNTVDQLAGDLRKAQIYAMTGKKNSNWGVAYGSFALTLYQGSAYSTRNSALDEIFNVNSNISVAGFTDINFARVTGLPNVTATITVSGNNNTKTITVNTQGVVSR